MIYTCPDVCSQVLEAYAALRPDFGYVQGV
jgi:hypothetical protein